MKRTLRALLLVTCAFGVFGATVVTPPAQAGPDGIPFRCEVYALKDEEPVQNGRLWECYY